MDWLNLAGRVILIKSMLTALPIYQFVAILAPASTHKQIELIIRGFLWQGGKSESKKFSLVKWDQITLPYKKGGMSIRLPAHLNLALRTKIEWRLITGKGCWWKQFLESKYMNHAQSLLLVEGTSIRPSSQVWKLVKKFFPLIKEHTPKLRGNGKGTNLWDLWEDRIMKNPPLATHSNPKFKKTDELKGSKHTGSNLSLAKQQLGKLEDPHPPSKSQKTMSD